MYKLRYCDMFYKAVATYVKRHVKFRNLWKGSIVNHK